MSSIDLIIQPKKKDLGDGFQVRRCLPDVKKRMVGPFIFWDHMGPVEILGDKELKVRAHPHIGLATITYLFSGEIMHRDNLGYEQAIRPGEVNWMTAGKGISHSERSKSPDKVMELEGIQIWVALPIEHEEVEASFVHHKEKDLPFKELDGAKIRLIAGELMGMKSPLPVYSPLFYSTIELKVGSDFTYKPLNNEDCAIYVVEGSVEVDGKSFHKFDMIIFKKEESLKVRAIVEENIKSNEYVKFMFFGGMPFEEGRHIWWNFVASSKEKIEEAKLRWKNNGFGIVINEEEYIPLPDS